MKANTVNMTNIGLNKAPIPNLDKLIENAALLLSSSSSQSGKISAEIFEEETAEASFYSVNVTGQRM